MRISWYEITKEPTLVARKVALRRQRNKDLKKAFGECMTRYGYRILKSYRDNSKG